jgi:hypothetical protein
MFGGEEIISWIDLRFSRKNTGKVGAFVLPTGDALMIFIPSIL